MANEDNNNLRTQLSELIKVNREMVNRLDHLTEKVATQKEYKYQTVIDYLKRQGYNTEKEL